MTKRYIVIYYDGNETKASLIETLGEPHEIIPEAITSKPGVTITAIIGVPSHTTFVNVHEREDLALVIMQGDCPQPAKPIFVEEI